MLTASLKNLWLLGCAALICCSPVIAQQDQPNPEHLEFFERKVRPLLVDHCYQCHSLSAQEDQGGLLLDSRAAILKGGDSGEAIVPGDPDDSLLMGAVRYEDYEMPPSGELPEADIAVLEKWIALGAPWPATDKATGPALEEFDLEARRKEHWVWQPVKEHSSPEVVDRRWGSKPIDRFIFAKLKEKQLEPATLAEPLAIARRLHMDLVGLPPTPQQIATFNSELEQGRQAAISNLADRLLASQHFGERWGRHWLDLARYAESGGHEFDPDIPNAFQYRDYVIRAFNADIPYDQFVREQIAGDLLDAPRMHPEKQFNESILGTGFWYLGEAAHSPVDIRKDESDRFDNMIDVASKSFLGVTVSCARCHDHKFDAISTADYYSLTGFLHSSDYRQARFESMDQNRIVAQRLTEVDRKYQKQIVDLLAEQDLQLPATAKPITDPAIVFDFASLQQSEFIQDGFIFGAQPQKAGYAYIRSDENKPALGFAPYAAAANDPFWNRLNSITAGSDHSKNPIEALPRSGRTLRTPTFELTHGDLDCLISGVGHVVACVDSHRQVFGPLHGETIQKVGSAEKRRSRHDKQWVRLNLARYVGHRMHLEFIPDKNELLSIRLVAQGLDEAGQNKISRQLNEANQEHLEYANRAEAILFERSAASRVVFADFEDGYGDWVATGDAFEGTSERLANDDGKNSDSKFFVSSENPRSASQNRKRKKPTQGDKPTGTLTSPEFTIECDDIKLLVGGGSHTDRTCVNLVVDGKVVESATGENSDKLIPHRWNVRHLQGRRAKIQVVDDFAGRWGNISLDDVVFLTRRKNVSQNDAFSKIVEQWAAEREQLSKQVVWDSHLAPAMLDGSGEEANVYIRGNASKLGAVEPRHFLTAIDGDEAMQVGSGSGRLELAERINDPKNPLTSRVIVNRIWHHLMGRGLVPTTDDFGVLGQRPTHPELLDFLASEFLADGRSLKRMIKRIVMTETYQMASHPNARSVEADPKNLLWHHRPPKRLEGEIIRDALLAITGKLDTTQHGPSIPVHLTSFMEGRGRPKKNGPLDGARRRSIYVSVRRNFLSPFMLTFDTPSPFSTMGRRTVSNVPAQALILMNDPFVSEQAKAWASRCLETKTETKQRIQWMYQTAFARTATESELKTSLDFLDDASDIETWSHFAHALINTKEFIFLR